MKRKNIFCCVFSLFLVLLFMLGYFGLLKPVGSIGDTKISSYEFSKQAQLHKRQLFEEIANDIAFETLVKESGVSVSKDEINAQMTIVQEQFPGFDENEVYAICRKSILQQKIIEKFASEVNANAELARKYYDENRVRYGEGEPDYERIKSDMQMEMGEKKYEEYLNEIKTEHEISFYG